jgi:hypothetical protein
VVEPLAISGNAFGFIVFGVLVLLVVGLWVSLKRTLESGEMESGGSWGQQLTDSVKDETPDDLG